MKLRLFLRLSVAILLLTFGTVLAACGGDDDELTLEEYFQRFQAIGDDADERLEALHKDGDNEFASEEEELQAYRDFVDAGAQIQRDFVDALDDIEPPPEVEDPHNQLVDALPELLDLLQDLVAAVESVFELQEPPDPELEAAQDRSDQACFELQDIADANGIDVHILKYCS